jgi:cytochrome b subunit of formate dehydrogenase
VDGRTIVHTTKRERRLVWAILIAIVVLAVAGLSYYGAQAPTAVSKLPPAQAPVAPESAPSP